jgi:hypothetical protein
LQSANVSLHNIPLLPLFHSNERKIDLQVLVSANTHVTTSRIPFQHQFKPVLLCLINDRGVSKLTLELFTCYHQPGSSRSLTLSDVLHVLLVGFTSDIEHWITVGFHCVQLASSIRSV